SNGGRALVLFRPADAGDPGVHRASRDLSAGRDRRRAVHRRRGRQQRPDLACRVAGREADLRFDVWDGDRGAAADPPSARRSGAGVRTLPSRPGPARRGALLGRGRGHHDAGLRPRIHRVQRPLTERPADRPRPRAFDGVPRPARRGRGLIFTGNLAPPSNSVRYHRHGANNMNGELSRRRFLQLASATSLGAAAQSAARAAGVASIPFTDPDRYDDGSHAIPGGVEGDPDRVIVVGAGFAGLAVANALSNAGVACLVVEGRARLGGRAHTVDVGGAPIDLGCSWITDPVGNPMTRFATRSRVLQTNAAIEADVPTSRFYDERTGVVLPPGTLTAASHAVRFEQEGAKISAALGPDASTRDGILRYADEHGL